MDATTSIDLTDAELFALDVPHQLFDRIRAEQPVYWSQTNADDGFWALTRHADVETVNRDTASFTSSKGIGVPRLTIEQTAALADNLMFVDPPRHTKMRKLISAAFTPRRVARLEELIVQYCGEIVASIHDKAEFDFVHEVAAQLPVRVIADIMGMPESDRGLILQWALGTYGRQDNDDGEAEFMESFRAIFRYVAELREHKLESPGDDVFTELTQADVDGERLTDGEFANFFFLLSQAGFETTHTLLAQGQQLMFEHPDQEQVLRDDPMLIGSAVEEMLRHVTPITHQARTATRDVLVGGQPISQGQYVSMWLCAANRDPEVFRDPHRFDVTRQPNPHVAFGGGGPHYCLGAHLSRLEARLMFSELLTNGPRLEPAGRPERLRSVVMNSLKHLPVRTC